MRWLPPWLGLPGVTAGLALVLALPLATIATPRWQEEAAAARLVRREPPPAAPLRAAPALPASGDPAARVADLLELALRHGVAVQRTQQRLDETGPVQRLQLGLNARGRYGDLRSYLEAALLADPTLALDRVSLHRTVPTADDLEADLQWSLMQARAPGEAGR